MTAKHVAALALAVLALAACSSGADSASESSAAPASAAPSSAAPSSAAPSPTAPSSAAPSARPAKPSVADMATDRFADAVLEQLKITSPDTFSDQLVTIALSPLLRQLASSADLSTRLDSKGSQVTLDLIGKDMTCTVTVTDKPQSRGVACKSA